MNDFLYTDMKSNLREYIQCVCHRIYLRVPCNNLKKKMGRKSWGIRRAGKMRAELDDDVDRWAELKTEISIYIFYVVC